jgi:hypothetical protein
MEADGSDIISNDAPYCRQKLYNSYWLLAWPT